MSYQIYGEYGHSLSSYMLLKVRIDGESMQELITY